MPTTNGRFSQWKKNNPRKFAAAVAGQLSVVGFLGLPAAVQIGLLQAGAYVAGLPFVSYAFWEGGKWVLKSSKLQTYAETLVAKTTEEYASPLEREQIYRQYGIIPKHIKEYFATEYPWMNGKIGDFAAKVISNTGATISVSIVACLFAIRYIGTHPGGPTLSIPIINFLDSLILDWSKASTLTYNKVFYIKLSKFLRFVHTMYVNHFRERIVDVYQYYEYIIGKTKKHDIKNPTDLVDLLQKEANKQTQKLISTASKTDPNNSNAYKIAHSPTEVIQQLAHAQRIQVLIKERDKKLQTIKEKIELLDPTNGKKTTKARLTKLVKDEENIKQEYQKRIAGERHQLLARRRQNKINKVQLPSPPREFQKIENFVAKTAMNANINVRLRALENMLSKRNKTPTPRSPSPRKSVSAKKTPSPPTPYVNLNKIASPLERLRLASSKRKRSFFRRRR
jgi:hypothetical protein